MSEMSNSRAAGGGRRGRGRGVRGAGGAGGRRSGAET
jgi:hypothetical protein